MITVPSLNDPDLAKLIQLINSGIKPIKVDVVPEEYSVENECFPNVQEKIKRDGGKQIIGWQAWKTKIIIEAEFHAIWESKNGTLVDVTPKKIPIAQGLFFPTSLKTFLPDPQRKYEGYQVDNVRLNITDNLIVDDFIKMAKTEFSFLNQDNRKFQYKIVLNKEEQGEYSIIRACKDGLELMAIGDQTRESYCFCGSGKPYKDCCYQIVKNF
jgi:hypothetical protein